MNAWAMAGGWSRAVGRMVRLGLGEGCRGVGDTSEPRKECMAMVKSGRLGWLVDVIAERGGGHGPAPSPLESSALSTPYTFVRKGIIGPRN